MIIEMNNLFCDVQRVFEAAGMTAENASQMADVLVTAEARGVYSHGIQLVGQYLDCIRRGIIHANPQIKIMKESDTTLLVDGDQGLGGIALTQATRLAIEKAKKYGTASLSMVNTAHYGAGAYYVEKACKENMIGFLYANTPATAAPFGGAGRYFGTHPYSFAAPAGKYGNIVLDMATTETAAGKLIAAINDGRQVPATFGVDKDGNPSTDPAAILYGGAMNHFGGVKGYGIAFMIHTVTGVLSGSAYKPQDIALMDMNLGPEQRSTVSFFMNLTDISKFIDPEEFKRRAEDLIDDIKQVPAAPGFSEILHPGELENRRLANAKANGVNVHDAAYENFCKAAQAVGVVI